eukprot:TRINITY_DN7404_c0_g1_i1.p1 TRINITY_DN7404_c0_g1~~TRINITY_DN7404_c0_g1_i1.p1  ORF type:complete len:427 (+),score=124.68 TRINITY_DN7404_c0_g1_i1:129-1409(+)
MDTSKIVVIDNGTGYTKMGYAGNQEPSYIIPTVIADSVEKSSVQVSRLHYEQLDFHIGEAGFRNSKTHQLTYLMQSAQVQNWELMEKFWHRCIFDSLRCEPDQHIFVLTEPPMNPPESREQIAEIFFETFGAKGLYIGVQAVLSLYSNWTTAPPDSIQKKVGLSGTVVDSGDGVTHIIPIADGYVIGSCVKHIPIAGRDITKFIMQSLKDRGEPVPPEDYIKIAKEIKEKYGYLCKGDLVKEISKWDERSTGPNGEPALSKKFKKLTSTNSVTGEKYTVDVGYEAFLGPEIFFKPEFADARWRKSLPTMIDESIINSPIDVRRKLYENVVLSGGSTLFKHFTERLKLELQGIVDTRLQKYETLSGTKPKPIDVNISENPFKYFSVWHGGSMIASQPGFSKMYHSREKYLEEGPSIARHNPVFAGGM